MAFQTALLPVSVGIPALPRALLPRLTCFGVMQDLAAATAETWPSIANILTRPWGASTPVPREAQPSSPAPQAKVRILSVAKHIPRQLMCDGYQSQPRTTLPRFLRDELPKLQAHVPAVSQQLASPDVQTTIANMSSFALAAAANPLVQRPAFRFAAQHPAGSLRRLFSTAPPIAIQRRAATMPTALGLRGAGLLHLSAPAQWSSRTPVSCATGLSPYTRLLQIRGFGNGGISRNMLANLEAAANRNPNSATAQNAFYQVLLKANLPAIVVERYKSGRYAKNQAIDEAYMKALSLLSGNNAGDVNALSGQNSGLSHDQIQAIGQAVAAQNKGGNIAISAPRGSGVDKDGRIHVLVDESRGTTIFRWVRFLLVFVFVCYLSLIVVSMVVESLNSIKRTGTARADAEVKAESQKARFADVHGCEEAKEELQELVEFLKNPEKFSTLGGKLPKGILLVGPPGTGKTLLARAVAGEAGVPFFYMSGSEFDEIYVGVGAKRVRDLFNAARSKSPAIIFIDELDAIGGKRNTRDSTYVKQTLNQLLTELDGFDQSSQVIILAATNFPQLLDKALTRPGRFDRHVQVDLPDVRGRLAILKHHAKKIKLMEGLNLQELAQGTSGLSGAELENIVNSAAIHASKNKSPVVNMKDLIWAKDKVVMGAEKRSMVINENEKLLTAYHEAGHALMALYSPRQSVPLYKVTILPRGMSLGHTAFLPEMDKYSYSSSDYVAKIDVSLGGKVAEEIVYGNEMVTSGVSGVSAWLQ